MVKVCGTRGPATRCQDHEQLSKTKGPYLDPEAFIEDVLAAENGYTALANFEGDSLMKGVYLEMAANCHRCYKELTQKWRDVRG